MKKSLPFILIFIFVFIIYFLTSAGKTPYDYFTRLSAAFLKGKYYLTENPSWLSELIPGGENKFFVVYPPGPAIAAIPFVFFFGDIFEQQWLAHLFGAGIVILTLKLARLITKNKKLIFWSGLLIGFGSIVWFLSATGSSWYLGQITACFFLFLALIESLDKKRPLLTGLFLGAAYLSRVNTIVSLPFFLYIFSGRKWFRNFFNLALGLTPFFLFNFGYNFIRFGVVWDQGYFLLPSVLNELSSPWFAKGVVNPVYIPNNLRAAFWSFPKIINHFPYLIPSWAGLAIWITTPAFIFAFKADIKNKLVKVTWLTILIMFLVVSSHGGTGWAQFGYRFAVDFYPFLIFLTILGVSRSGLKIHHWLLLSIGILVNLWGVIFINKLGLVSF